MTLRKAKWLTAALVVALSCLMISVAYAQDGAAGTQSPPGLRVMGLGKSAEPAQANQPPPKAMQAVGSDATVIPPPSPHWCLREGLTGRVPM